MMGADRRISFWNTAAERIFGYAAEEAMGRELHPLITPAAAATKLRLALEATAPGFGESAVRG